MAFSAYKPSEIKEKGIKGAYKQRTFNFQLTTLFHKTIGYNRLARKIAIANLGGPVKRKINKLF